MTEIYFKESQKINVGWKWLLFISLYVLMFWSLSDQLKTEIDIVAMISIIFSICVIICFNIIIVIMSLDTKIDNTKVAIQYKPFHIKTRLINWNEVSDFYIRNYKPLKEYGGHGIKKRIKYGKSYTVSGRKGLQLIFKDGKKILVGTQKPKELEMLVDKLKSRTN